MKMDALLACYGATRSRFAPICSEEVHPVMADADPTGASADQFGCECTRRDAPGWRVLTIVTRNAELDAAVRDIASQAA